MSGDATGRKKKKKAETKKINKYLQKKNKRTTKDENDRIHWLVRKKKTKQRETKSRVEPTADSANRNRKAKMRKK